MLIISLLMPASTKTGAAAPQTSAIDYEELWNAWDEFFIALNQARGRAAREQSDGLTVPRYRLLSAVAESPAARSGELAGRMGVSAPTTTRMLSGLERDGIVRRDPLAGDRRAVTIALTDKGRRLLSRKQAVVSEKRRELFDSLTASERRQARRLLRRLAEVIEAL
jgi:MarR family transcriptional regulator, negative regulator of the multidrug operon emrRAB